MPEHAEIQTDGSADTNDPVDVALEIALEAARDNRVREHIREAQQHRERVAHEATDAEVRSAVPETAPASGGDA